VGGAGVVAGAGVPAGAGVAAGAAAAGGFFGSMESNSTWKTSVELGSMGGLPRSP
jgi:hypothetical protein